MNLVCVGEFMLPYPKNAICYGHETCTTGHSKYIFCYSVNLCRVMSKKIQQVSINSYVAVVLVEVEVQKEVYETVAELEVSL